MKGQLAWVLLGGLSLAQAAVIDKTGLRRVKRQESGSGSLIDTILNAIGGGNSGAIVQTVTLNPATITGDFVSAATEALGQIGDSTGGSVAADPAFDPEAGGVNSDPEFDPASAVDVSLDSEAGLPGLDTGSSGSDSGLTPLVGTGTSGTTTGDGAAVNLNPVFSNSTVTSTSGSETELAALPGVESDPLVSAAPDAALAAPVGDAPEIISGAESHQGIVIVALTLTSSTTTLAVTPAEPTAIATAPVAAPPAAAPAAPVDDAIPDAPAPVDPIPAVDEQAPAAPPAAEAPAPLAPLNPLPAVDGGAPAAPVDTADEAPAPLAPLAPLPGVDAPAAEAPAPTPTEPLADIPAAETELASSVDLGVITDPTAVPAAEAPAPEITAPPEVQNPAAGPEALTLGNTVSLASQLNLGNLGV